MFGSIFQTVRNWLIAFGILGAILIVANYAPLAITHSDQDSCSFGPVTNGQYRAYLAEVKHRQQTEWPRFTNDGEEIARQLNVRFNDMIGTNSSPYAKLAIMHAVLRAIGAEYLNTTPRQEIDAYGATVRQENARFNYEVDINRLVVFQPYPRRVWVLADLAKVSDTSKRYGAINFAAHVLVFPDYPAAESLASSGESCPPVPNTEKTGR
jgi:hypothetical protein